MSLSKESSVTLKMAVGALALAIVVAVGDASFGILQGQASTTRGWTQDVRPLFGRPSPITPRPAIPPRAAPPRENPGFFCTFFSWGCRQEPTFGGGGIGGQTGGDVGTHGGDLGDQGDPGAGGDRGGQNNGGEEESSGNDDGDDEPIYCPQTVCQSHGEDGVCGPIPGFEEYCETHEIPGS